MILLLPFTCNLVYIIFNSRDVINDSAPEATTVLPTKSEILATAGTTATEVTPVTGGTLAEREISNSAGNRREAIDNKDTSNHRTQETPKAAKPNNSGSKDDLQQKGCFGNRSETINHK